MGMVGVEVPAFAGLLRVRGEALKMILRHKVSRESRVLLQLADQLIRFNTTEDSPYNETYLGAAVTNALDRLGLAPDGQTNYYAIQVSKTKCITRTGLTLKIADLKEGEQLLSFEVMVSLD